MNCKKYKYNFIFFDFIIKIKIKKLRGDLKIMENKELKERFIDKKRNRICKTRRLLYSKFGITKTKENTFE